MTIARADSDRMERFERAADVLAVAMREAIARRHWTLAERLADASLRLPAATDDLNLEVARLRIAQGRTDVALATLERIRRRDAEARLLRAICLILLDRAVEARMELNPPLPPADDQPACAMLRGLLDAEAGHCDDAKVIAAGLVQQASLEPLMIAAAIAAEADDHPTLRAASAALEQLALAPHQRQTIAVFLATLEAASPGMHHGGGPRPAAETAGALADFLLIHPSALGSLLAAQRIDFDPPSARLLLEGLIDLMRRRRGSDSSANDSSASDSSASEPADLEPIFSAIVELSRRLDGPIVARGWIEQGLECCRGSRGLRRMLEESLPQADTAPAVIARIGPAAAPSTQAA